MITNPLSRTGFNCSSIINVHYIFKIMYLFQPSESNRRYDWLKTESGLVHGHNTDCMTYTQGVSGSSVLKHCFCNCESEKILALRYFSLLTVTSDVDDNK